MQLSDLNGQVLLSATLDEGRVRCETDKATFYLEAIGDCCSHGWIDGISCPTLPAKITDAPSSWGGWGGDRTVQPGEPGYPADGGDVVVVYGSKIATDAGDVTFNVWNDSNGYYGSSLELVGCKTKEAQ